MRLAGETSCGARNGGRAVDSLVGNGSLDGGSANVGESPKGEVSRRLRAGDAGGEVAVSLLVADVSVGCMRLPSVVSRPRVDRAGGVSYRFRLWADHVSLRVVGRRVGDGVVWHFLVFRGRFDSARDPSLSAAASS